MKRHARKRGVRASTLNLGRLNKQERERLQAQEPDDGRRRIPLLRSECEQFERPCPYVSCRYHLFLDVSRTGNLKLNFPDLFDAEGAPRLEEMPETCSLDVAAREDVTLEKLGELMNITRERARQLEQAALERVRTRQSQALSDWAEGDSFDTETIFDNPHASESFEAEEL